MLRSLTKQHLLPIFYINSPFTSIAYIPIIKINNKENITLAQKLNKLNKLIKYLFFSNFLILQISNQPIQIKKLKIKHGIKNEFNKYPNGNLLLIPSKKINIGIFTKLPLLIKSIKNKIIYNIPGEMI